MATTIKVPEELRDVLNTRARAAHLTVAEVIAKLLDADRTAQERAERFRAIRDARARTTPSQWREYDEEVSVWQQASSADLARYDPRE